MSMPQGASQPGRLPILECVREGFAFLGRDWRLIAPVALIGAVFLTPLEVWAETAVRAQDLGTASLLSILGALVQIPVLAAYYRRAVSRGVEPLAMRLGADERNLAGVTLSVGFVFMIVTIVGFIVLLLALGALMVGAGIQPDTLEGLAPADAGRKVIEALGTDGNIAFIAIASALLALFLWLAARLALAYAATVAENRMMIFSTWAWTKGNASSIVACLLLTVIVPSLLLGAVLGDAASRVPGSPVHWLVTYVSGAAALFFIQAPYAGLTAYLYRGLRPT